jgi:hypothetical protein
MKKAIFFLFLVVLASVGDSSANAQSVTRLIVAKSDYLPKDRILSLRTDKDGNVVALIQDTGDGIEEYPTSQLRKRIVLYKESRLGISKDINWISSDSFDPSRGGRIQLTVLREFKSIFSFDYRVINFELWRDNGEWRITLADMNENSLFDTIQFTSLRDSSGAVLGTDILTFILAGEEKAKISTSQLRKN